MRRKLVTLMAAVTLLGGGYALASDMTLARDGGLYRVIDTGDELVVSQTTGAGTVVETPVPQTNGIIATSLLIRVDEATGTTVVVWQQGTDEMAQVFLATLREGTWFGPYPVAGGGSISAANPALLVHRVTDVVDEEEGPVEYSTAFLHLAWWEGLETEDGGAAYYAAATLDDQGAPDLSEFNPLHLSDLIPFGIGCYAIDDPSILAHPRLFIDPETGDPHILAVDVPSCLFQILQLEPALEEWVGGPKRRRHTIVLGYHEMIAIDLSLPMHAATVEVGHDLTVVMHWDTEEGINYVLLDEDGWSEARVLALTEQLDHEKAVELIRGLAR
jgi:hypothetical protein